MNAASSIIPSGGKRHLVTNPAQEPSWRLKTIPTRWRVGCGIVLLATLWSLSGGGGHAAYAQARQYRIDPQASVVRVLVYRRGVLSVLAHDHVLVAKEVQGRVVLDGGDVTRSSVTLRVGAAVFDVDAPAERQKAGFLSELTDGNRKSILEAMTGPEVLNAAQWPAVTVASEKVAGRLPDLTLSMRMKIRDREQVVSVPTRVVVALDRLRAAGQVELVQTSFGITPYETLLGAIAVQDKIMVQFEIEAVSQP